MSRTIKVYIGYEISEDVIARLKHIAKSRYDKRIYDDYYSTIENIQELSFNHDLSPEREIIILGEDWFINYTISDSIVTFLEWVAIDNQDTKLKQTYEMMQSLKAILINNQDKQFTSDMRHDTSYQFYLKLKQRGFIKEDLHGIEYDICSAPEGVKYIDINYNTIEEFFESEEAKQHPEYYKFILHHLAFTVTDKFVKKYKIR